MRALGAMHLEEGLHLLEDAVERPGLVAVRRDRVAVHRIARPDDLAAFLFDGADQLGQMIADLVGAEAPDQGQPAGLVVRIERVDEADQAIRRRATGRISGRAGS